MRDSLATDILDGDDGGGGSDERGESLHVRPITSISQLQLSNRLGSS